MLIAIIEKHERKPRCCAECNLFVPETSDYGCCPITDYGYDGEEQRTEDNPDCSLREVNANDLP